MATSGSGLPRSTLRRPRKPLCRDALQAMVDVPSCAGLLLSPSAGWQPLLSSVATGRTRRPRAKARTPILSLHRNRMGDHFISSSTHSCRAVSQSQPVRVRPAPSHGWSTHLRRVSLSPLPGARQLASRSIGAAAPSPLVLFRAFPLRSLAGQG